MRIPSDTADVHTSQAEEYIQKLRKEIDNIENSIEIDPEVIDLETKISKLRYQKGHLERAILSEQAKRMVSFPTFFASKVTEVVHSLYPDVNAKIEVGPVTTKGKAADYQTSACFLLSKEISKSGTKCNPKQVAEELKEELAKTITCIDKIEVTGPGFLNFYLKNSFVNEQLQDILMNGVRAPGCSKRQKIVIDFSSPNIAKEMHVGHLRSTIIGETISRLLEFMGHDVKRVNHLGDWGTQFGMLIAHLEDKFPNHTQESPPICDLQEFYKESKKRFDTEPDFKQRAYRKVVDLQAYEKETYAAWKLICELSLKEFQMIYDRLDIKLEPYGESYYNTRMKDMVKRLEADGTLTEGDGCKLIFVEGQDVPLMVVKSDGGFTYDTSDLATMNVRMREWNADWGIYVVDNGQALHFELLFAASRKIGFIAPEQKVTHVGFGVVLGEDKKKFKTRSGDTVKLRQLLDEGLERAENKIRSKEAEKKEKGSGGLLTEEEIIACRDAVAYGCIKFADLSCTRTNDYVFSFDKMLDDKGKTAVYLLYALTRIRSIARVAGLTTEELLQSAAVTPIHLEHEAELKLAKTLLRFAEVIEEIGHTLLPHTLCSYLYDISIAFTHFYDNCYCVEKDKNTGETLHIHTNRLLLCEATARVMEKCSIFSG